MPRTPKPTVPSKARVTGVRTITVAFDYASSSKQNSDDFFRDIVTAFEKVARNRARQAAHDTKVNTMRTGRITWDEK